MPDFGAHTPFIIAAYIISALTLGGLIVRALKQNQASNDP